MRSRRWWLIIGGPVAAVVLSWAAWTGWQAWQVSQDLSAASRDASALQEAVLASDQPAQERALEDLASHASAAVERTDGISWSVLERAPFIGDDAEGVRVVSEVVASLADEGVRPLIDSTDRLDELMPRGGRVSLEALTALRAPVGRGEEAFAAADAALASQDASSFIGRLRDDYRELASRVSDAHDILASADTAIDVMPEMLGGNGARQHLLVFQNNAEIRATGGLPGAVSVVAADDGEVRMTTQVAASSFGEREAPVLPLEPAELQIYGPQLGTYFLDANFTPDFPRAADLMSARWQEVYGDQLDGVAAIDPVALSYLLTATGPVTAGDLELTADNVVDTLLHDVYIDYPDPAAQDAVFRGVARAVFDRVSQGVEDPIELVRALARGVEERRIYVHSFDAATQRALDATEVAGLATSPHTDGPQVGVYLNDGTGSKMSYFLRFDAHVRTTFCSDGVQGLSGSLRLESTAPPDAASLPAYITGGGVFGTEPGHQLVFVRLYGPVDGSIADLDLNSERVAARVVPLGGRPVVTVSIDLAPGEVSDLSWTMRSGRDQTGDVDLTVTPGVDAEGKQSRSISACG